MNKAQDEPVTICIASHRIASRRSDPISDRGDDKFLPLLVRAHLANSDNHGIPNRFLDHPELSPWSSRTEPSLELLDRGHAFPITNGSTGSSQEEDSLDAPLPYAPGLWAVEHREGARQASVWPTGRATLAPFVELRQWKALTQPILLIEALGTFCKTDDPSAALDPRAQQLLSDLLEAIGPARDVLRTSFRKGRRRLRM